MPTWVSVNRPQGAQAAFFSDTGANVVIMDDGFQNPVIYKDFSLVVVDGAVVLEGQENISGGPWRVQSFGLSRANAVVIVGDDLTEATAEIRRHSNMPILKAVLKPFRHNPDLFGRKRRGLRRALAGLKNLKKASLPRERLLRGGVHIRIYFAYEEEDLRELVSAAEFREVDHCT